jgi:F0F1-type ATP synthase membrane subunit c/vacuolar-type H+-ATPase subunit K
VANPRAAIATAVAGILTGWATAVIATDLITGWWRTDRLFCVAIGFLTAVSAAALVGGLIALLLRRRMARLLIVVGSLVALLIFAGLFVAGAKLAPVVYGIPVLPVVTVLLALLPATRRWARSGSD